MAKVKLTDAFVKNLKPADGARRIEYGDRECRGLYVCAWASGKISWSYRFSLHGKAVNMGVGVYPDLSLKDARNEVDGLRAVVMKGDDPRDAKRAKKADARSIIFSEYVKDWIKRYAVEVSDKTGRPRRTVTVEHARSMIATHLEKRVGKKPMQQIAGDDLKSAFDAISSQAARKATFAYASIMFKDAVYNKVINSNPLDGFKKPATIGARKRVLTDKELNAVWTAAVRMSEPARSFFHLLMLTGQRRDEVAGMDWAELDRDAAIWTIPAERAKNGETHIVPLAGAVIDILDRLAGGTDWPADGYALTTGRSHFQAYSKAKAVLDDASGVTDWRIHDLRRTMATGFQRLGVRFEVTEAVLNHVSGARGGVAGVYQRYHWADEKRAALEAWAAHVEGLTHG